MKKAKIIDHLFGEAILITFGSHEEINDWYKKRGINCRFDKFDQAITEKIVEEHDAEFREYWHIHFTFYGFSLIVHETNHLAFEVLNKKGIKLSRETMEIFAYYQDWIAAKCRDYFEKWISKPKRLKQK